jgi:hypothetical protein
VEHQAAEDVLAANPTLAARLTHVATPLQGVTSNPSAFLDTILESQALAGTDSSKPIALVITKTPETVLLLLPASSSAGSTTPEPPSYYLFDSHSRPSMGIENGFLATFASPEALAEALSALFPPVWLGDVDPGADLIYNAFEATVLQSV